MGELGDGGSDNFISIMGIDTLKIEAADGSYFKLNGFEMGFCSVGGVTITPETGAAITRARAGDESYYTIDVSSNTDFQYIRYFTISGTDMIMNIDDLDFSPAVLPTHTVTYNSNGNTGGTAPTDSNNPYTEGDTVTVLGNTGSLVKTGYTFAGWNIAANGSGTSYSGGDTFAMGSSNVTLYAQWAPINYTVTYNGNTNTGGSVPTDGNNYNITNTVTVLGNTGTLVKTGYTFAGWNTADNGSGTSYSSGDTFAMGSSNVTLYAQWTENTYSVTYNGNSNTGGSVPNDATGYHTGDTATVLGNTGTLVRTGYTFAGWNTAANGSGTSYSGGNTFAIGSSNVTLYAQWTAVNYTVTYNGNTNTGGSVPTDGNTYHITDTVSVLGNTGTLVKTGYTFAGWNTAANGSGIGYSAGNTFAMGSNNVTLYAQWTENTYTITYDGNGNTGGSVPTDVTDYHYGDIVTVLGNTGNLVRTGYTFAGWNTVANGSGTSYPGSATFAISTSNVTLFAKWIPVNYTVTYNGNTNTGGSVPTDGNTYTITSSVTVLGNTGNLVRTGYTFAGWNTVANGSGASYTGGSTFTMGSSDVTLYAQWIEDVYSITYSGNNNTGGSVPTDATSYNSGDTATVLGNTGNLVRTGYTFAGWNTVANGSGTSYSAGNTFVMGSSNITLYAQWAPINYTVTYNGNSNTGGSVPTDGNNYNITDTVTVLGNTGTLVKTAYTFVGWNTVANGSGTSYSAGNTFAMGSNNVTLYAQWTTAPTYNVIYDGNGSNGGAVPIDNTNYLDAETVTVLSNTGSLVKTGYTFAGWNTLSSGLGTDYAPSSTFPMGSSNITLYAKWTADTTAPNLIAGTVSRTSNTLGTVKFTSNEAGSYYYAVVADGASVPVIDTTGVGLACTTAETTITNPIGLTAGAKDIYIKVKDAAGNISVALKIDIAAYVAPGGGSSSGSSSGNNSNPTTQLPQDKVTVIVNGTEQNAGTETKVTENGKSTVTITVDSKIMESKIDEVIKTNPAGVGNIIQIPVADTQSEIAKVQLTGDIVKKLEENNFDISVKRDDIEYIIPAEEFTISKLAENLGVIENSLVDINIEVKITKLSPSVVAKYNEVAKSKGAELVFPPVSFELIAKTTNIDGSTREIEINNFRNYVERIMEIPTGVDPNKITTGVVFNSDGTYSHVPTEVFQKDGKWFAKLNSLTNSDYSVIWNSVTIKSVENHWAKDAVNDMASRLIIFNPEEFNPNKAISRADFAEYIVRALGLYKENSTHENKFKDVSITGERTLAILIANEYGIVSGYSDGTFRGDNQITREEAMTMYHKAMSITKLVGNDKSRYKNFSDYSDVSGWASSYVKDVLSAHVFNGTTATRISPKESLTYAESAQAIKNLLIESKLINK